VNISGKVKVFLGARWCWRLGFRPSDTT